MGWIAYGQLSTLALLLRSVGDALTRRSHLGQPESMTRALKQSRYLSGIYGFCGVFISLYGFSAVIRLMVNDTVCVVV